MRRFVVQPIERLTNTVGADNPDSIVLPDAMVRSHGEIGRLSRAFGRLLSAVELQRKALLDAQNNLLSVMDHTVDGLIMIDETGKIVTFSQPGKLFSATWGKIWWGAISRF